MRFFYALIGTVLTSAALLAARAVAEGPQSYPQVSIVFSAAAPVDLGSERDVHLAHATVNVGRGPIQ